MTQSHAACIYNPTRITIDKLRDWCQQAEQHYGFAPTRFIATTVDDDARCQVRDALGHGPAVVIAAGGDGTVRLAAEALADTGVPLAIVPLGTGNLLARTLELSTPGLLHPDATLAQAVELAFAGGERDIDLVRVAVERPSGARDAFVFAVIAGIGIDAGMISNTNPTLKKRLGWPAYGVGILRWLVSSGSFRARYRVDQRPTYGTRAASIMVGNSGTLTGGLVLMRQARIDDGVIDMIMMRPRGPLGWVVVAVRILAHRWQRGQRGSQRMLGYHCGRTIMLRLDSRPEEFQVDGDTVGPVVAARFTVMPRALRVRIPHR
ncbi:diacylglycerol/lipid kinase family protein [Gulosibacter bifidus]|uniref:Diacylglycerol/lipid kinase family protein n=1 Tax=Gulosibacter bifidus TaxID=272239 RepID=A0ABW5RJB4_9MICO|nr:diacylglycerol kinase family protein [Gulosibacter bifidus]